ALNNITLSIKHGEKIGICGRSGSGKSSLILSLFHMIETTSGSTWIANLDISTIPRDLVRNRLLAAPQDPLPLCGTVRYNVDPLQLHSDEAITTALTKVELWNTVREKGRYSFSHGQRQLLSLARVLLRSGSIVVLDESTSSIDYETGKLIQKLIRSEFADRTVIAVAHRLGNILDFNKMAIMSEGKLVEFDTPEVTLKRDSAFRRLYDSHSGGLGENMSSEF
ncbi:P-loop containing nucleoside triphosphate hydrolase protein, partial [Hyaloscypha variabilis F]